MPFTVQNNTLICKNFGTWKQMGIYKPFKLRITHVQLDYVYEFTQIPPQECLWRNYYICMFPYAHCVSTYNKQEDRTESVD